MRQDEDIERRKKFPWKTSFRRPLGASASNAFVMIILLIYLLAFASTAVYIGDARYLFPNRVAIPFH